MPSYRLRYDMPEDNMNESGKNKAKFLPHKHLSLLEQWLERVSPGWCSLVSFYMIFRRVCEHSSLDLTIQHYLGRCETIKRLGRLIFLLRLSSFVLGTK